MTISSIFLLYTIPHFPLRMITCSLTPLPTNQAAAFAYAYYKVEAYGDIDGFLLNRQTDAPEEVAEGLAFGLNHVGGGTKKQIYTVFKYIDTPEHAAYTDFAKSIIGISSWSEIIR